MYKIKEIYLTIQCEGFHAGRTAIFCRFTGCNLWSGREEDRATAQCSFCDTDFWGMDGAHGGKYNKESLVLEFDQLWKGSKEEKFIVFTGGEPLLQLDDMLITAMHNAGYEIAIETNGTITAPQNIDWICVSPKAGTDILIDKADELKLVFPQKGTHPLDYTTYSARHFYLQPMDDNNKEENTQKTVQYCLDNPKWKLSIQTHKYLGID